MASQNSSEDENEHIEELANAINNTEMDAGDEDLSDDEPFKFLRRFIDAKGGVAESSSNAAANLNENMQEVIMAMTLFYNNEFIEAKKMLKEKYKSSIHHALGYAVFQYLEAIMTFESDDIATALSYVKNALVVARRYKRKENITTSLGKIIGMGTTAPFTELELHAELAFAELHLLHAGLTFIQDENMLSFIKGALHVRKTYQAYSTCKKIAEKKKWVESANLTLKHFLGGVELGSGAFNILLSLLPQRIISLLEWVGFNCDKQRGFEELQEGFGNTNLHSSLCGIVLLGYYLFAAIHFGTHDADWNFAEKILSEMLQKHPEGIYFLLFAGRMEALKGNFEEGKKLLIKAHETQQEWKQFSHICYWELMWYNAFQLNWEDSFNYAQLLKKESKWSKAVYTYLCAVFLIMQNKSDNETNEKISNYLKEISKLRQRLAGKSIPMEKFVARKARKYFEQGNRLVLPAMEMMYVWFGNVMLKQNPMLLKSHLKIIENEQKKLENLKETYSENNDKENAQKTKCEFYYFDDYCLLQLLRGTCLSIGGQNMQAELALNDVIQSYNGIKKDHYLAPYAAVDLAWIYINQCKFEEAKTQIKNIKQNYKHYSLESKLHFRMHSAQSKILELTDKTKSGSKKDLVTTL